MIEVTAKFQFPSAVQGARFLLNRKPKKKQVGTVAAYFLRRSAESIFEILFSKRSQRVGFSELMFGTPCGAVKKRDLLDSNGVLGKECHIFELLVEKFWRKPLWL